MDKSLQLIEHDGRISGSAVKGWMRPILWPANYKSMMGVVLFNDGFEHNFWIKIVLRDALKGDDVVHSFYPSLWSGK